VVNLDYWEASPCSGGDLLIFSGFSSLSTNCPTLGPVLWLFFFRLHWVDTFFYTCGLLPGIIFTGFFALFVSNSFLITMMHYNVEAVGKLSGGMVFLP